MARRLAGAVLVPRSEALRPDDRHQAVTLSRLPTRDENGRPQPLRGYMEALRWSAATTVRPFLSGRGVGGVGSSVAGVSLVRYLAEEEPRDPMSFVVVLASLAASGLLLWLTGTALLYLYAVLQGGVEKK